MKRSTVTLFTLLLGLPILLQQIATAGPEDLPVWQNLPPGTLVSTNTPEGARSPIVRYSAVSSRLIIAYEGQVAGSTDPYYTQSTNNVTWATPKPIYSSPGVNSTQLTSAFLGTTAHAVWVERSGGIDTLVAAKEPWPVASPKVISDGSISGFPLITSPEIIASGSVLHVVWSEGLNLDIYYSRSTDGGNNWSVAQGVNTSIEPSQQPDIAVDQSGKLHVVWEEQVSGSTAFHIYYAQGTLSGSTVSWSAPLPIFTGTTTNSGRLPQIISKNNQIQVAFTNVIATNQQAVLYKECSANCTALPSWSAASSISGEYVGENTAISFFLHSDMVYDSPAQTTYVYFHGYKPDVDTTEIILGVNSCDSWAASVRDELRMSPLRAIYPSITVGQNTAGDGLIQLAYEGINAASNHQIYHMWGTAQCQRFSNPTVYMPATFR
jgi:hypothetical protein